MQDKEPPKVSCRPLPDLDGDKDKGKGKDKDKDKDKGKDNDKDNDSLYQLLATDNCDPNPKIYVTDSACAAIYGPFSNGNIVEIERDKDKDKDKGKDKDKDKDKHLDPGVVADIHIKGDALLYAVDADGNVAAAILCPVPPPCK